MKRKVLIIKSGHSETIDPDNSGVVSLGDVLRTTMILHLYPPETHEVTWVATRKSEELLKNNSFIHELHFINTFTPYYLASIKWDVIVNFEKDKGICALYPAIGSDRCARYGYYLDNNTINPYPGSRKALLYSTNPDAKREKVESWSEVLYEMCGSKYKGQNYIFENYEKQPVTNDVGFNWQVGKKFPDKAWNIYKWRDLAINLYDEYSVSHQPKETNLQDYFKWISSCSVIVTNDSLGLHLALAMRKRVVALFGPTYASEIDDFENLIKIYRNNINDISVDEVCDAVRRLV